MIQFRGDGTIPANLLDADADQFGCRLRSRHAFRAMASNYLPVSSLAGSISSDKVTGDSRERARQEIARSGIAGMRREGER